ncbi:MULTISPECIES: hypothetical protein [unclassified Enterococcus]|uniref:hypothetical protein n=1 Tax=unclassified Enterococcus TaxID=2608891 RepID=UPI001F15108D|nr:MULTISPECIES: hypothetical protein [unclassified Enterococcus]
MIGNTVGTSSDETIASISKEGESFTGTIHAPGTAVFTFVSGTFRTEITVTGQDIR